MFQSNHGFDGVDGVGNEGMPWVGPGDFPSGNGTHPEDLKKPSPIADGNGAVPDPKKGRTRKPSSSGRKRKPQARGPFAPGEPADAAGTVPSLNNKGKPGTLASLSAQTRELAERNLEQLERAATDARTHQWTIGDCLIRHQEEFGLPLSEAMPRIEKHGLSMKTAYQYVQTAKVFNTEESREGLSWYGCFAALSGWKKLPLDLQNEMSPKEVARKMITENLSAREVRKLMAEQARSAANRQAGMDAATALKANISLRESCFNMPCEEMIPTLSDGSVTLAWFDPPYANYTKNENTGELVLEGSYGPEIRCNCANLTKEQGQALTIAAMRLMLPKMASGGALVLWQAGGKSDNWKTLKAAEDAGWICPFAGLWDKQIPQPGNLTQPFSISTERFLVFYRAGDEFIDHSMVIAGRREIIDPTRLKEYFQRQGMERLDFYPITREFQRKLRKGEAAVAGCHVFEKPASLNEFFLNKFTYEGDLICDLCGCSGSMAEAAIKMNRRWLYCEADTENGIFDWGVSRIAKALDAKQAERESGSDGVSGRAA